VPYSKNVSFGVSDVQDLCAILAEMDEDSFATASSAAQRDSDSASQAPRASVSHLALQPSPPPVATASTAEDERERLRGRRLPAQILLPKAISMLASRACRTAVMIGDTLDDATMRRIVRQLATIEHPWACPHGRPTMRHVLRLPTTDS
jgi:DNA mismatch repair protein PMS2